MNPNLQSILGDLYSLDPKLRESEKDLIPLLEKLVESKPDLKLDEQFVSSLRNQIMVRANELMESGKPTQVNWFHRFLTPLMGGSVALAALVIGLMVWNGQTGLLQTPKPTPEATSLAMKDALPPSTSEPVLAPKANTSAKPATIAPKASEKVEQRAPVAEESPASAPMLLQALPAENGAGATTPAPEVAPTAALRQMAPVSAADQTANRDSIINSAFTRAQAGELKITANSEPSGSRLAKDIIAIDFNKLPEGFVEIPSVLPAGTRAFEDLSPTWSDGLPQYYLYFEKENQWYGPF